MAANINDKFTSATNGSRPSPTTLTAIHTGGDTTMTCNALTGWPTDTAVHFIIYTTDTDGNKVAGSQTDWKGVVSGSTITNCVLKAGTDSGYSIGAIVECAPTAAWADDLTDGLRVEHDQDGTHSTVTATSVTATTGTFTNLTVTGTATSQGWTPLGDVPDTVTYNGNRIYDIVFNGVDHTSTLSPGMKLQLTRTVAAPDQCADLEASSTQYFSKSSPAGMTFTDDFTCMAWVKLESYAAYGIITRYGGTTGFVFQTNASGQLLLQGLGTSGNGRIVTSYASLPLNKWVHIAATMDMSGSAGTVYFDGTLVDSAYANVGAGATALVQSGNLNIGATNGINPFDGKIAQAAVFSSVLSAATIRSYASQGLSGSESTLVSAYSFDNSINDLNTTNANNLTANGGAAATNADSPFANAVSAGLLEYAEINSVTFSTNTTVNVRVPDTCQIPTTGGISSVYYSTQSNPYGLPAFSNIIGQTLIMSNFTSGVAADVSGMSVTAYIPTGRRVKVTTMHRNLSSSSAGNVYQIIYDGASVLCSTYGYTAVAGGGGVQPANYVYTPTSGSHTYKVNIDRDAGNATLTASTTAPAYLRVELV